jgi:hypothetical protein
MKRLASVIISIVFIFTACDRHAVEREVFSTAETGNEVFETEEREQAENEESSRTTGYYAGAAACVIAAVGITAAVIYKCRSKEIEKTYGIFARTKQDIRLTVREILYRLRGGGIPFNFEINNVVSIRSIGRENNGYRLVGTDFGISIYDCNVRSMKPLATIQGGSIIPEEHPLELFTVRTTTKHIKTLKITSDNPENTEFLNELIEITTDPPVEIPEEINEEGEVQERRPEGEVQEKEAEEEAAEIVF